MRFFSPLFEVIEHLYHTVAVTIFRSAAINADTCSIVFMRTKDFQFSNMQKEVSTKLKFLLVKKLGERSQEWSNYWNK